MCHNPDRQPDNEPHQAQLRFPQLNLPPIQPQVRDCSDGVRRIMCLLRRRPVALTPEEWVRQHFVAYMVQHLGYPAPLMANEVAITLNGTSRRCDTVLYSPAGLAPRMIVEYKAPDIVLNQKVFDQIVRYNMVLRAPYLVVSNGLKHFALEVDYQSHSVRFLPAIPPYARLTR